jgi:hypothetical protein
VTSAVEPLEHVAAPTLLIVGSEDREVIELNRQAYARLRCEKHLEIIPGATHLFEEPGTLETVARLAAAWFRHFLVERPQTDSAATQGERVSEGEIQDVKHVLPGDIRHPWS